MFLGWSKTRSGGDTNGMTISSAWRLLRALGLTSICVIWAQSPLLASERQPPDEPATQAGGTTVASATEDVQQTPTTDNTRPRGTGTQTAGNDRVPPTARHAVVPAKVRRYAARIVKRYDADGDGRLQPKEWVRMNGNPFPADLDGDGEITVEEFAIYVAEFGRQRSLRLMPFGPSVFVRAAESGNAENGTEADPSVRPRNGRTAANELSAAAGEDAKTRRPRARRFFVPQERLPKGLPEWFLDQDANGDGQLTMAEFAEDWTATEATEFRRLDADGDGVIMPREYLAAQSKASTSKEEAAENTSEEERQPRSDES